MREMTRTMETMIDNLSASDRWELLQLAGEDDHDELVTRVLRALAAEVRAAQQAQDELLGLLAAGR